MIIYHRNDNFGNPVEISFDADTMDTDPKSGMTVLKKNSSDVAKIFMCAGEWIAFEAALVRKEAA